MEKDHVDQETPISRNHPCRTQNSNIKTTGTSSTPAALSDMTRKSIQSHYHRGRDRQTAEDYESQREHYIESSLAVGFGSRAVGLIASAFVMILAIVLALAPLNDLLSATVSQHVPIVLRLMSAKCCQMPVKIMPNKLEIRLLAGCSLLQGTTANSKRILIYLWLYNTQLHCFSFWVDAIGRARIW